MASASSFATILPLRAKKNLRKSNPSCSIQTNTFWNHDGLQDPSSQTNKLISVKAKAAPKGRNTKPKSVICADCDGNGAVLCSQCKGSGVNAVDLFNGQFKAGDSCWLCGGKKEMLCGNCNGAGFVGGFMSTLDE